MTSFFLASRSLARLKGREIPQESRRKKNPKFQLDEFDSKENFCQAKYWAPKKTFGFILLN
jgi:hypothetical protein